MNQPGARLMQLSQGFSYTWGASRPVGQRVLPDSLKLDGRPIDAAATLRITVNAYMASGGDNFLVFKQGRDTRTGMMDVDALELYVKNNPGLKPGAPSRVTRLN